MGSNPDQQLFSSSNFRDSLNLDKWQNYKSSTIFVIFHYDGKKRKNESSNGKTSDF